MVYNLCSSPSPLLHNRHSLCKSLIQPLRPCFLSSKIRTSIQITNVSLQDPISQQNLTADAISDGKTQHFSSKFSAWINPRSSRASHPENLPYDSRYSSLVKLSESLNSCSPNEDDVFRVLSGFGQKFFEQDAVVILNNMSNPDTAVLALKYFLQRSKSGREVILYNVTMKVFKKTKDLDSAEKLFDEMLERGLKPNSVTFLTLIGCAKSASLPGKAIQWFEIMPSFSCVPNGVTCTAMIDPYGRTGNVDMALSLYERAKEEKLCIDAGTFVTLIKMYVKSGNFDGCLNLYEEMKVLGVEPNVAVYNSLLDAMGRAKRPWQAKNIYTEMTDNGISPNWGTYASLLRAYARVRFGEEALKVYKEMKEKGWELNVLLYNTILTMCADVGYVDEAVEIFQEMKQSGSSTPDSWTYSSMITAYSCSGKVSEAEGILEEMLEAGLPPSIFVLTSLVQCYGKAQLIEKVIQTFNQVLELGLTPDYRFCACLLNVMTQTPNEQLGKLIVCVEKANPKLGQFIGLLVEEHDSERDLKKEASELFESLDSGGRKACCNSLTNLCFNLNLFEQARELVQLGISLGIYGNVQSRLPVQWSLHLKGLSRGAALTALDVWIKDLSSAVQSGEELPPLLGIETGHGKHRYSDQGLAAVFQSHLEELKAPFHATPDKVGWFLTTNIAAISWLEELKNSADSAAT